MSDDNEVERLAHRYASVGLPAFVINEGVSGDRALKIWATIHVALDQYFGREQMPETQTVYELALPRKGGYKLSPVERERRRERMRAVAKEYWRKKKEQQA